MYLYDRSVVGNDAAAAQAQEAKTKFTDLPEEFRKNVFPQLVEECKDCQ